MQDKNFKSLSNINSYFRTFLYSKSHVCLKQATTMNCCNFLDENFQKLQNFLNHEKSRYRVDRNNFDFLTFEFS